MADIKELAKLIQELEEQLVVCMRCGMCQAVCPVYDQTGRETDVARGKLALLDGLRQQLLESPERVNERLNRCLLCGSCAANCPSGVNVMEIFLKARAVLNGYIGLSAPKKAILRGLLTRPKLFDQILSLSGRLQPLVSKTANEVIGTSCARFMSPLLQNRHFTPLAKTAFHQQVPAIDTASKPGKPRVALFVGCLIDKIYPRIARATLDVLHYHGVGVFMPADQGCCGIPAAASGDSQSFVRLLRHNLDKFEARPFDYLITACATCTSTIHEIWPMLAPDAETKARAQKISEKTLDINDFLVSKIGIDAAAKKDAMARKVTYHDPCHLKKGLNVWQEPRTLLDAHPGIERIEMDGADRCCGMGGSFNLMHYDISSDIGRRKAQDIRATGCDVVTTGCPACMMQISDMLSQAGDQIAVQHPIEIYAEYLRNYVHRTETDQAQTNLRSGI